MKTTILFSLLITLTAASPLFPRGQDHCDTAPLSKPPQVSTPVSTLSKLSTWGPYISQESSLCRDVPEGLGIDQVTVLLRHGARGPTADSYPKILGAVAKAANATVTDDSFEFVKTYKADDFIADALTDYGRKQLYDAGVLYAKRYKKLTNNYFSRASGQGRVVESGQYFMKGFLGNKPPTNTLTAFTCPAADAQDRSAEAENNFNAVWMPPVTARLNHALSGANLTDDDVRQLFTLYGYDGVKNIDYSAGLWCKVFSDAEFSQWEYLYDASKYWGTSYGNPYRAPMYDGFVNEMIARWTGKPVVLGGSTNSTTETDPATFPLDKTFYADFTQDMDNLSPRLTRATDSDLMSIMTAFGLWKDPNPLPTKISVDELPRRFFHVGRIAPFGSRFIFERLADKQGTKYIRIQNNDAVVPLNFPDCGIYGWAGLCELDAFVAAQSFAQEEPKHYNELCYGEPTNTTII